MLPRAALDPSRGVLARRGSISPGLIGATLNRVTAVAVAAVSATSSADLFGGGAAKEKEPRDHSRKRGADIEMPLALSFEEAIKGLTTNITVNRSEQCSRCNGAGDIGGPVVVCSTCKGSGQVQRPVAACGLRRSVLIVAALATTITLLALQGQRHTAEDGNGEGADSRRSRNWFARADSRQR